MDNLRINSKDNYWHTTFFNRLNFRTSNQLFQNSKRPSSSVKLLEHNGINMEAKSKNTVCPRSNQIISWTFNDGH
jgi:hypothetical protein